LLSYLQPFNKLVNQLNELTGNGNGYLSAIEYSWRTMVPAIISYVKGENLAMTVNDLQNIG
jgi:hypothetical protein